MNKEEKERLPYVAPHCKVIPMEEDNFICNSVLPNGNASTVETSYDDKGEHDVGTALFGDKSTVAPAKQHNSLWDEEEEE